jgi:hypothetical protein
MNAKILVSLLGASIFWGCGTAQLPAMVDSSKGDASAILEKATRAHGGEQWESVNLIRVEYEGEWASVGPKVQPVLADTGYRSQSVEFVKPATKEIEQRHRGPAGVKNVVRTPDSIRIVRDGSDEVDPEALSAAALVADAYRMFLTGPFFFASQGLNPRVVGSEEIDGEICDRVFVIVRPGFGDAAEDLSVISIGRDTGLMRRVRITLSGFESTQGAEVDVTFRNHKEIDGFVWPTQFVERIRAPFRLAAHEWTMVSLQVNPDLESGRRASLDAGGKSTMIGSRNPKNLPE